MVRLCMRDTGVIGHLEASQQGAGPQTPAPVQNGRAVSGSAAAPIFQRRILQHRMGDLVNATLFLGGLGHTLSSAPGVTKDDVKRLKAFLGKGKLQSLATKIPGGNFNGDTKYKVDLHDANVNQADMGKVSNTLGLLQGAVELDLSGNGIKALPNLQGMTSLRILKLENNPLTELDMASLPPTVTVWLGSNLSPTVARQIMANMSVHDTPTELRPTILFGKDILRGQEAPLLPPPGCQFQTVTVVKLGREKLCTKVDIVEDANGKLFIVKPTKVAMPGKTVDRSERATISYPQPQPRPQPQTSKVFSSSMRVPGDTKAAESKGVRDAREARMAIGVFASQEFAAWEKSLLAPLPTVKVICEKLRRTRPDIDESLREFGFEKDVEWRLDEHLEKNTDFAVAFKARKEVIDVVENALNQANEEFRQHSKIANPPLVNVFIESLYAEIKNTHPLLHQQLGGDVVRNYVANHVETNYEEKLCDAFKAAAMKSYIKDFLHELGNPFTQQEPGKVPLPESVIIRNLCMLVRDEYPEFDQPSFADAVKRCAIDYVAYCADQTAFTASFDADAGIADDSNSEGFQDASPRGSDAASVSGDRKRSSAALRAYLNSSNSFDNDKVGSDAGSLYAVV